MAGDLRDPHTPSDGSCPGVASAVWESLVRRESDQMVSAHSMLRMTMLAMAALSVLLVVMEVLLSVLMVLSLPPLLPANTGRFGIVDGMLPSMGAA